MEGWGRRLRSIRGGVRRVRRWCWRLVRRGLEVSFVLFLVVTSVFFRPVHLWSVLVFSSLHASSLPRTRLPSLPPIFSSCIRLPSSLTVSLSSLTRSSPCLFPSFFFLPLFPLPSPPSSPVQSHVHAPRHI
ncbi:hypothetical protein BDV98DRAFT_572273 [Pterulicium gracile]|uniref:Transmembrane protein n=1 Tax=Pterulicium gracile TaxID=1884261 RepID=A0A5C3Q9R8_9AGAR|nr:hypothetical protein BDV98DRAFT_572273 [Pterula gracilis]